MRQPRPILDRRLLALSAWVALAIAGADGPNPLAGLELLDMVGGHGVQQAYTVVAGNEYLPSRGKIQKAHCFAQSFVAGSHTVSVT